MKSLEFDAMGFDDFAWWVEQDRKKALKILKLIKEIQRTPFTGTGQPEALKHELSGCWSRRIDQEHRLIYEALVSLVPTLNTSKFSTNIEIQVK